MEEEKSQLVRFRLSSIVRFPQGNRLRLNGLRKSEDFYFRLTAIPPEVTRTAFRRAGL